MDYALLLTRSTRPPALHGPRHFTVIYSSQVLDAASVDFMRDFYLSLIRGHSVQNAFDKARASLMTNVQTNKELRKFLLLPVRANHDGACCFFKLPVCCQTRIESHTPTHIHTYTTMSPDLLAPIHPSAQIL